MAYYSSGCPDCHSFNFVTDYSEGDVICTGCGLVQEACISVDESFYNPNALASAAPVGPHLEKQVSHVNNDKLRFITSRLNLSDAMEKEASAIFDNIREKYSFRGQPLNCALVGSIYIACNIQHSTGVSRDAKELCSAMSIDFHAFSKTLKVIYELMPDLHRKMKHINESDTLTRQIQSIPSIPDCRAFDVAKETKRLDEIRKSKMLLLGSPPNVVNAVLIFVACGVLGIRIHKTSYIDHIKISRATLDKYVKLLNNQYVF